MLDIDKHLERDKESIKELVSKYTALLAEQNDIYREAVQHGDISENAEVKQAQEEIAKYSSLLASLQNRLRAYEENSLENPNSDVISIGSVFSFESRERVRGKIEKREFTAKLVPRALGKFKIGALAVDTPIGSECEGLREGDTFKVRTPVTLVDYIIIKIHKEGDDD